MPPYRVFISHKDEDQQIASAVSTAMGNFTGDLQFFISGENIAEGEQWHERLREELRVSDMLLLLFTEPTRNWDWCLYEVGLFQRLEGDEAEPVVCLYSPDAEPPSPLAGLQGVRATVADVSQFIGRLIRTTEITKRDAPLNATVSDEAIQQAAGNICDLFAGNIHSYYACHRLYLELPPDIGECDGIPAQSVVRQVDDASDTLRALFGRLAGAEAWRWGDLVEAHLTAGSRWIDEINRSFTDACNRRVSMPTTHTFRSPDGASIFRPELYRLDKKGSTPVAAVLVFTEETAPAKVGGPVFNRLRIAERYKEEVFDPLEAAGDTISPERLTELASAYELIREEAATHNVFENETLRSSFPDLEMQAELVAIGDEWRAAAAALQAAVEDGDNTRTRSGLLAINDLNDRYRAIVATRYAQILNPDT